MKRIFHVFSGRQQTSSSRLDFWANLSRVVTESEGESWDAESSCAGIRMVHLLEIIFNANKQIIVLLCNNEHDLLGLFL